ncbi:MAG: hypothetical protein AAGG07_10350 [Planctomycetota bacterium]
MARLASLIPTKFAKDCATDGFVEACKSTLDEILKAPDAAAAVSVLAGAAGGPAVFIGVYAGMSFIQWKMGKRSRDDADARLRQMHRALGRIEDRLRDNREVHSTDAELDELFQSDAGLRKRFADIEVRSEAEASVAVEAAVRDVFGQLGIEESFEGVRVYLSNMSDWLLEVRADARETRDIVRGFRDGPDRLATEDDIRRIVEEALNNKPAPSLGPDGGPPIVDERVREAACRLEHSSEASLLDRVNAAILSQAPEAERLLDELDRLTELADYTRHQRRGDYHYFRGEFDAAIEPYEEALELRPGDSTARNNAAVAHNEARLGSIEAHQQRAIAIYVGTLDLETLSSYERAQTQNNLGNAYQRLPTGDRGANLGRAIEAYEAALEVRTREARPVDWARTQNNLGTAYEELPTGDRGANLGRAIEAYEAALEVSTRETHPVDWARTQNNLGNAYAAQPTGDRGANLGRAIEAYEAALEVRTREAHPVEWAMTQYNMAIAIADLADVPDQDRCGLLKRSISASKGALTIRTLEAFPHHHADTSKNLAIRRAAYEATGCTPAFDDIPPAE